MPQRDRYRLKRAADCGYGRGMVPGSGGGEVTGYVLQKWYPELRSWCDVGDPMHYGEAMVRIRRLERGLD